MSGINRTIRILNKSFLYRCYTTRSSVHFEKSVKILPSVQITNRSGIPNRHDILFSRMLSTNASVEEEKPKIEDLDSHSLIRNTEKPVGSSDRHEFQAETRMLLNIVARSLYSENEVFIRELISNASDALEKFRYTVHTAGENEKEYEATDRDLEIYIGTDKFNMTITIQDTGIGMTKEELISNLGTIARSGSKNFLDQIKEKGASSLDSSNIIGQFGVGFYSAFMVADKVEVFTKSSKINSPGYRWSTDGSGVYEIQEAEGVSHGTKIVVHLKKECREFSDEERVKKIIQRYSNFVGSPVFLNGIQANQIKPIWLMDPKEVTKDQHRDFYNFIADSYNKPRFVLQYKTDVPLSIRALLYFPDGKPGLFALSRDMNVGVALYSKKVLIQSETTKLIPKWLRFIKGVVDSEDIPLNLSRELLQNSALIQKISTVLTTRIIKFLQERASKEPDQYIEFYNEYSIFLKEGIVSITDRNEKEEIGKLLLFESSSKPDVRISLDDYCKLVGEQKDIYYLSAPNRFLAESSPYYESLKKKKIEVLFCYDAYDELVLMQLATFKGKPLISAEKDMGTDQSAENMTDLGEESLSRFQVDELITWLKEKLAGKIANAKVTNRLESHPCVVIVEEMAAARHFIRTQSVKMDEKLRFSMLQPQLDINPKHPIIKKLYHLKTSDPELAELLTQQLFSNSMVAAGLIEDPRILLTTMNELLAKALEKH